MAHTRKHKRKGYMRKLGNYSRKAKNIFGRAYGKAIKAFYRSPPSPIPPPKAPSPLMPLPYLPIAPPPNPVEPRPKRRKKRWPRHVSFAENAKK
jgi:hypothetical protein